MLRAIIHAFARRKGGRSPAAPAPAPAAPASTEQRPPSTSTPAHSPDGIDFNGVSFQVVWTVADFVATTASSDRVALRLRTEQYASHMRDIMRQFDSKHAPSSPEYQAFKHACLICAGCRWKFPSSYIMSLIMGGLNGLTVIGGLTPGNAEFSRNSTCTKCGNAESFLTYQRYEPSSISQADVDAIRRYWRHCAEQWWSNRDTSRSTAICDFCNDLISRDEATFFSGDDDERLGCEDCTDKQFANGLNELRRNPFYYGATELQKARSFALVL
jgi:hypothetical protein